MDSVVGDAFLASNGLKYLSTDDEGKLIIAPEFRGSAIYDLSRDLIACFKSDDYYYPTSYSFDIFTEGRAVLAGTSFLVLMKNREKMTDRYGYLPFPKADTEQTEPPKGPVETPAGCQSAFSVGLPCLAFAAVCVAGAAGAVGRKYRIKRRSDEK